MNLAKQPLKKQGIDINPDSSPQAMNERYAGRQDGPEDESRLGGIADISEGYDGQTPETGQVYPGKRRKSNKGKAKKSSAEGDTKKDRDPSLPPWACSL